ncbi:transmembrane protein 79-like [Branchiostoma floridae]|uniref:Transmembrane protein 79-like n=1 Tax=Branchiostoma floridae TaxID=7739 RepID=A0A9J7MHI6_BRAFL|nr:transmembrane protein 79-like [Branchiostoma floridae]
MVLLAEGAGSMDESAEAMTLHARPRASVDFGVQTGGPGLAAKLHDSPRHQRRMSLITHQPPLKKVTVTLVLTGWLVGMVVKASLDGSSWLPWSTPALPDMTARMIYCARCLAVCTLPLLAGVVFCTYKRIMTPALDPLAGHEHYVEVHRRFLENTVEQFLLLGVNLVPMTATLSDQYLPVIPAVVALFLVGRFLFWVTYVYRRSERGFPYMLSVYPSMAMFMYNMYMCL